MFIRKAALRPTPAYATIDASYVEAVEYLLGADEMNLQATLDLGYRDLDRKQPELASWLANELTELQDELAQALGYFLVVTIHMIFREAFPTRLHEVDENMLTLALETLATDEALRANDPYEVFDSDDVIAMEQPALVGFIQHHIEEAIDQSQETIKLDELECVYRAVLIEVIALGHAVASPSGVLGPTRESLA